MRTATACFAAAGTQGATRDCQPRRGQHPWDPRFKSIYDQVPDEPSTEAKFTQPTSAIIRVASHDVLNAYLNAANEAQLKEAFDAKLS